MLFRPGNKRGKGKSPASNFSTMETVLFGQNQLNVKYGTMRTRLAIASAIYQVNRQSRKLKKISLKVST